MVYKIIAIKAIITGIEIVFFSELFDFEIEYKIKPIMKHKKSAVMKNTVLNKIILKFLNKFFLKIFHRNRF